MSLTLLRCIRDSLFIGAESNEVSAYGEIFVVDGAAAQIVGDSPVKLNAFASNGVSKNTTPDHINDQIGLVLPAGRYKVSFHASFVGSETTWTFYVSTDGGVVAAREIAAVDLSLTDIGQQNASGETIIDALDNTNIIAIMVEAGLAAQSITVEDAQLVIERLES
jgi:hypothetical protein